MAGKRENAASEEQTMDFWFNTGLVGLDKFGKFNQRDFDTKVVPLLRGRFMRVDGMFGCHITRYGLTVKYLDGVITREAVLEHVEECIRWASKPKRGLFPLRGKKVPKATLEGVR